MKIAIIGAGGFGREVLALIKQINAVQQKFEVVGFIDDGIAKGSQIHDLKVIGSINEIDSFKLEGIVIAIGNSIIRRRVFENIQSSLAFPNIIHPTVLFIDKERIALGHGNIICAGNILTTDIQIGNFCIVNIGSTIGHDAELADFSSIMPGVNISGGAKLREGVYVGTGAKLIKATTLGANAVIGAGAIVDTDIPANTIAVGIPAKPIKSIHD